MAETVQQPRSSRAAAAEVETAGDLEALKAEIASLRHELDKVARAAKDVGTSAIGTARAEAEALADRVVAEGRNQVAELEAKVREQPLMAVALAFGAGLLFARLTGR